ncbi:MAG: hypothetical protein WD059_05265 [Balneolaceae bacterium]
MKLPEATERFFKRAVGNFLAFVGVSLIIGLIIYFWFPDFMPYIIEEDHLVENLSAFSYLLAFVLALWVLKNYQSWRKLTWFVAAMGLIGFFDEISFGERIINFTSPEFWGEDIDAVHDILAITYVNLSNIFSFYELLFIVLASVFGMILIYIKQTKYTLRDFIGNPKNPPGIFLVFFAFFLVTASLFDMKDFIAPLVIMEELFEMFGGVALCLYSISLAEMLERAKSSEFVKGKSAAEPAE